MIHSYRFPKYLSGRQGNHSKKTAAANSKSHLDVLEVIVKFLPLVTLLFVCLGYFNLHTYYGSFGIKIYNYLDASEIIFSFVAILYEVFGVVFIAGLYVLLFYFFPSVWRDYLQEFKEKVYPKHLLIDILFLVCIFLVMAYFSIRYFFPDLLPFRTFEIPLINWFSSHRKTLFILVLIFPFFVFLILHTYLPASKKAIINWSGAIMFFIAFSIFIYLRNYVCSFQIKQGNPNSEIELICQDGKEIKSTEIKLFIGSTKNYYFFCNKYSGQNTIIPVTQVLEERFTAKEE